MPSPAFRHHRFPVFRVASRQGLAPATVRAPARRPGAAAEHGGDAGHLRFFDLLRADEVNVAVDAAGGDDHAFAGDDLGARPDDDVHARLHVRIAGLADGGDAAALDADVGLDDAPVVDDGRVGDDAVAGLVRPGAVDDLALSHAVADGLAAAELDLLAVADGSSVGSDEPCAGAQRVVGLDLDDEAGVGQPQATANTAERSPAAGR